MACATGGVCDWSRRTIPSSSASPSDSVHTDEPEHEQRDERERDRSEEEREVHAEDEREHSARIAPGCELADAEVDARTRAGRRAEPPDREPEHCERAL